MGAQLITVKSLGASMKEAYNEAVEEAVHEYGNDSYNGTISTTNGYVDKTKEFKSSGKSLSDYAEWLYEENKISKWGSAVGICMAEPVENKNKIKSQVNNFAQKGTREWKTVYKAETRLGLTIGEFEYQVDAIKKAREYTEKYKVASKVTISKKLTNGSTTVAEITYKTSSSEREGTYFFIAIAAE